MGHIHKYDLNHTTLRENFGLNIYDLGFLALTLKA